MSGWRERAAETIQRALRRAGTIRSLQHARLTLRHAYPFGERKGHPYRCWLLEVRLALIALAKLHGWEMPKPLARRGRRKDVPGQLMLWGGGFLSVAAA